MSRSQNSRLPNGRNSARFVRIRQRQAEGRRRSALSAKAAETVLPPLRDLVRRFAATRGGCPPRRAQRGATTFRIRRFSIDRKPIGMTQSGRAYIIEVDHRQAGVLARERRGYVFFPAMKELARLERSRFASPQAAERAVRELFKKRQTQPWARAPLPSAGDAPHQ